MIIITGIGHSDSHWTYFGALCAIFAGFKILNTLAIFYPIGSTVYSIKTYINRYFESKPDQEVEKRENRPILYDKVASQELHKSDFTTFSLTWSNLSITLPKNGKVLVDNISGYVTSGKILALMGPSGAGKTTLLNGLSNRADYAKITGNVLFAGRKMTPTDLTYVPQFDVLNKTLSVSEHMLLVGNLTCSDKAKMMSRYNKLLEVLGLEKKKDAPLTTLSGGSRAI